MGRRPSMLVEGRPPPGDRPQQHADAREDQHRGQGPAGQVEAVAAQPDDALEEDEPDGEEPKARNERPPATTQPRPTATPRSSTLASALARWTRRSAAETRATCTCHRRRAASPARAEGTPSPAGRRPPGIISTPGAATNLGGSQIRYGVVGGNTATVVFPLICHHALSPSLPGREPRLHPAC